MIKIQKAKKESRARDQKRGRFVLTVGKKEIHMTLDEVMELRDGINRALYAHAVFEFLKGSPR